ncbi:MAG: hydrogenase 3 maturation endopeptidase HyCI [Anaerolineae bacterium]|nr:hydrogenase 3 maturation endopeptidase HyCI [Thermoflexales bacterium]MDW8407350.1 hydrogenase 3 maturation endopeptidase HyCI [Anaerolineae bacterium]
MQWLRRTLRRLQRREQPVRVSVVGLGSELHGDDAAGLWVVRALMRQQSAAPSYVQVVEAGTAPENVVGLLRRFAPHLVIFVDAAEPVHDALPGTVRWIDWRTTEGVSASTHTLPLSVVCAYLADQLGCEVALIGIQVVSLNADRRPSLPVRRAVRRVTAGLSVLLYTDQSRSTSA